MNAAKRALSFLLGKSLPMPIHCTYFGEASTSKVISTGIVVRRTLMIDVSKRIPKGISQYSKAEEGSDDEVFYLELNSSLICEFWDVIASHLRITADSYFLTAERGETVKVFFSDCDVVTVRARFGHIDGRKTYWKIDFVAVIRVE